MYVGDYIGEYSRGYQEILEFSTIPNREGLGFYICLLIVGNAARGSHEDT